VLGLFHPQQFVVRPIPGGSLILHAGSEHFLLEDSIVTREATIQIAHGFVAVSVGSRNVVAPDVTVSARSGDSCDFLLSVPGKITRRYSGILNIRVVGASLLADVQTDLETAVASVVAAENPPDMPMEAAKAQAIASRSFLLAGVGRHREFDFCDTTHCQFMREPPPLNSVASRASALTAGMVLTYRAKTVAAMYSRSCAGRTRTPAQLGLPAAEYPYYSVDCVYCRIHPEHWEAAISSGDAELLRQSREDLRLQLGRRLGWNTVPSANVSLVDQGSDVLVKGTGRGHGIGLCQAGARAMAKQGSGAFEILAHYYPGTDVRTLRRAGQILP
jgi:stage II sporulation protein D